MSLKYFVFAVLIIPSTEFFGQKKIQLYLTDKGLPIAEVMIFSNDKNRFAVSDQNGLVTWHSKALPDTVNFSHVGYLEQKYILHTIPSYPNPVTIHMHSKIIELPTAKIESNWEKPNSIVVQASLNEEEIENKFLVQDIPYIIQHFPSTVASSDAGNGIGYTNIRIRGLDPTQINVMINGVPLNDAESQSVFWVDLPDLIASASDIQVQRGIGTSGAGQVAFGSSLLINTNKLSTDPYLQIESAVGSFSTFKNSLQLNSGLMKHHWNFAGRLSQIHSNGFIDRATSGLWSGSFSISHLNAKRSVRFFMFDGLERSYQAWYGVPVQFITDPIKRRFNPAGTEKTGEPYDNQIDRYRQTHFQLLHKELIGTKWELHNTLHFTPGQGYYEEYKTDQVPMDYKLPGDDPVDLVRRRNLDNNFFGSIHTAHYNRSNIKYEMGLAWNGYLGRHFGEVSQVNNLSIHNNKPYYDHQAAKWSAMGFGKMDWQLNQWSFLVDFQYRWITYRFIPELGPSQVPTKVNHRFFNPKLGFSVTATPSLQFFGFTGLAHREPNREDYVKAGQVFPRAERLWDHELGARWHRSYFQLEQNMYLMQYKDQLIPNGKLNDVGAYIRNNVGRSYRLGSETTLSWKKGRWNFQGNLNLSQNKTVVYDEYQDNWDTGLQEKKTYTSQSIAFSPSLIGNLSAEVMMVDRLKNKSKQAVYLEISQQEVGRQYLDGTGKALSTLPSYRLTQLAVRYQLRASRFPAADFKLQVNNLFNEQYESNGWIYRFQSKSYDPVPDDPFAASESGGTYHLKGLYPQAGINLILSCRLKFGRDLF